LFPERILTVRTPARKLEKLDNFYVLMNQSMSCVGKLSPIKYGTQKQKIFWISDNLTHDDKKEIKNVRKSLN